MLVLQLTGIVYVHDYCDNASKTAKVCIMNTFTDFSLFFCVFLSFFFTENERELLLRDRMMLGEGSKIQLIFR